MAYERENLAVAGMSAALSLTMIAVYVLLPAMRSFPRKLLTALGLGPARKTAPLALEAMGAHHRGSGT